MIEDKTFSSLHDSEGKDGKTIFQTEKYMATLQKWKSNDDKKAPGQRTSIYGIVYKTSLFDKEEEKIIKDPIDGKGLGENQWTGYDINAIHALFQGIIKDRTPKNDLLKDYVEMLEKWHKRLTDTIKDVRALSLTNGIDRLVWERLFLQDKRIEKTGLVFSNAVYHGSYLWIHVAIEGHLSDLPIIE